LPALRPVPWRLSGRGLAPENELSGGDPECLERCVTTIAEQAKDVEAA
jgi:hypothetical protein